MACTIFVFLLLEHDELPFSVLLVLFIVMALVASARSLWNWICAPLVLGEIPTYPITGAKYWERACDLDSFMYMPMRRITPRPPHVYWVPVLGAVGIATEIVRTVSGRAGMIESYVVTGVFSASIIICIAVLIAKKVSIARLWGEAFSKLCPNLKVVYDDDRESS